MSDKCNEFVVSTGSVHKSLTTNHIESSTGVYKFIPPTRNYGGETRPIVNTSDVSFRSQLKSKCNDLELKCNDLLRTICERRNLDTKFLDLFCTHNSTCDVHIS